MSKIITLDNNFPSIQHLCNKDKRLACDGNITPSVVNSISKEQLKSIGTSINKAKCIKSLTESIINNELNLRELSNLTDNEVIDELCKIKGIGIWTAKMYLLFVLDRNDILPIEDIAFLQTYK